MGSKVAKFLPDVSILSTHFPNDIDSAGHVWDGSQWSKPEQPKVALYRLACERFSSAREADTDFTQDGSASMDALHRLIDYRALECSEESRRLELLQAVEELPLKRPFLKKPYMNTIHRPDQNERYQI